ncbi:MAG: phospholipase D family protein [Candidatus Pacearchaeota archaeon]|nr:phospholipase D family protein [Candidatus Pacearchaeota archaeon]
MPKDDQRLPSTAFRDAQDTSLGRSIGYLTIDKNGLSGAYLLKDGLDAFAARLVLAEKAERSLDVQYYIWHNDTIGKLFASAMLRAAERGVRVRVLLDDINTGGLDHELATFDSHPNIEIRILNPFVLRRARELELIFSFPRVNRRMHNKSFTADNQVTIVGGRNIGNEYYDFHKEVNFNDLDILTIGPIVDDVSDAFDQYWNSEFALSVGSFIKKTPKVSLEQLKVSLAEHDVVMRTSEYAMAVRETEFLTRLGNKTLPFSWGKAKVIYDPPEKLHPDSKISAMQVNTKAESFINQINSELVLVSPYFVPGTEGLAIFKKLIARGVRVRVLTNSLASTDVSIVYAGYMPYRIPLLKAGIELYEAKPTNNIQSKQKKYKIGSSSLASLHTKLHVIDRKKIYVGSYNLDPRSANINTELGMVFENEELARNIAQSMDKHIDSWAYKLEIIKDQGMEDDTDYAIEWVTEKEGKEQRYSVEPNTGFWRRLGAGLMSILPVEDLL